VVTPEELDEIYIKLRNLEVEIVDQAEVTGSSSPSRKRRKTNRDSISWMIPSGCTSSKWDKFPCLPGNRKWRFQSGLKTPKNEVKAIIYSFGFAGKEHIAFGGEIGFRTPKERFDRVILDKKIEGRENHLKALRKLVKEARLIDQRVDDRYADWQNTPAKENQDKCRAKFHKLDQKLHTHLSEVLL